jgi:hypothetical protein
VTQLFEFAALKATRIAARALAIVFGLLVLAYTATFVTAHAKGYYFRLSGGSLQFTTISGKRYAMFDDDYLARDAGWTIYESIGRTGFFWRSVSALDVGYSYNELHFGTDLILSRDGRLLFVRRNTTAPSPDTPIWTDVLDLTFDPPRTVIRGPDCCMGSTAGDTTITDSESLRAHGQTVLARARAMGAIE